MSHFERVRAAFDELPYMRHSQAAIMRDLIVEQDARDVLEIGFFHGKSSAYIAAILEDLGRGHLVTIDRENARAREPNIEQVLSTLGLAHRVTPVYAQRSYTWEMAKMIRSAPRPQFDLCYFDGGHTWDGTGFGFVLVDLLLRPGGWILFDDIPWTMAKAMQQRNRVPRHWRNFSPDEQAEPAVKLVFDLLVPHLGYTNQAVINRGQWGLARKPPGGEPARSAALPASLRRLLGAFARR